MFGDLLNKLIGKSSLDRIDRPLVDAPTRKKLVFALSFGGDTDGNIRIIDKINPDAIIAMPTFLYHLIQEGKSGGSHWANLKEDCAEMGANNVSNMSTYGFTEAKIAFTECRPVNGDQSSGFHIYPDMPFVEIINPENGERIATEFAPEEILFQSWEEIRKMQGVGKQLKQQKVKESRP